MTEYDMNTISAGDFTAELDITKEMYEDFLDNQYEPFGSREKDQNGKIYSPALYLKKYLSEELSRILTSQLKNRIESDTVNNRGKKKKKMANGLPKRDFIVVKDIVFAYNNY
jgi:hypothetical protein